MCDTAQCVLELVTWDLEPKISHGAGTLLIAIGHALCELKKKRNRHRHTHACTQACTRMHMRTLIHNHTYIIATFSDLLGHMGCCSSPRIIIIIIYSPVDCTRSPQGFSQVQISHKLNAIQNIHINYINIKRTNIIRKLVPSVLLS